MNILEIIVIGIIALFTLTGYFTGFFRVIYSLFAWTLAFTLGTWATPYVAGFLGQNTGLGAAIQKACAGYIARLAGERTADSAIAVFGELLEDTGIYERIASEVTGYILKGMAFLLVMVIGILMQVLWHILDLASRLPVLEGLNKMLGAAAGALKGLVIVWGLFCIIQLCSMTEIGQTLLSRIEESPVLKGIYDYNFLFRIIMKIIGI